MSFRLFKNNELFWAFVLGLSLIFFEMPTWAQGAVLISVIWRLLIERAQFEIPPTRIFVFLVVFLVVLTIVEFRTLLGRDAAGTLFFVLLSLKALEAKTERDKKFLWLLIVGLVHLQFLYSLEIYVLPLSQAAVVLVFLDILKTVWPVDLKVRLRFILKSIFITSPLVLALFFLFPRTQSPWGFGQKATAVSGFSDDLNAGDISDVSLLNQLAFRARFTDGEKRKRSELYWVGSRLYQSMGLNWKRQFRPMVPEAMVPARVANYEIHLEPHQKQWLFVLADTSSLVAPGISFYRRDDGVFRSHSYIDQGVFYEAYLGGHSDVPATEETLQLPEIDEELKAILLREIPKAPSAQLQVENIKKFFEKENFRYSLSPGMKSSSLKEFLLSSKVGFCEHFAGAAANILRFYNVPSRVVIGYQGGVYNPFGDFWSVFQKDAHAWVEYLSEENVWAKFDPISNIAPLRIELGASDFADLPADFASRGDRLLPQVSWLERNWEQTVFFFESLNYQWTMFLIEFNKGNQQQILREVLPLLGWFFVLVISLLFLSSLIRLWIKTNKKPAVEKLLEEVEVVVRKKGLRRKPNETPLAFLEKCQKEFPLPIWQEMSNFYIDVALRELPSDTSFRRLLKIFRRDFKEFKSSL
jgi:transglutaminase-like putative cysteine protease